MSNERIINALLAPRVSEKTARLQEDNQYAFDIAPTATKADVKAAVEHMFEVEVKSVNIANIKGKNKMFRFRPGRRANVRKAYVRLAEGQAIDVLAKP